MFKTAIASLSQLFYPHHCSGCGTDIISADHALCLRCNNELPLTNFNTHAGNHCEKIFWGRIPIAHAASYCYFSKDSLVQHLLHELKYNHNQAIGIYLGKKMGEWLLQSHRFSDIDIIVPLPLFKNKEKKRGYNQATCLSNGLSDTMQLPVSKNNVLRISATDTQTHKHRIERWQNMQDRFLVTQENDFKGKHILLVDDVVTTGATLESCGQQLLSIENTRLSIATLAYTIK